MTEEQSPPSRRRFFLLAGLGATGAALAAAAGWPIWRYLAPSGGPGEMEKASVPRSEVPLGGAHFFQFRGKAAVVLQVAPGQFQALSAVCTHLGCIVQWKAEQKEFLCPCHAGRFAPDGRVLGGPPPRALEQFPVAVSDDRLLIG